MTDPPERFTVSIPPNADLGLDELDELVEQSDCESRSEFIRRSIEDSL